jgi:hypothetical protein
MPTICRFYGITISIYFNDHAPPHFHARYGEFLAQVRIADGAVMSGRLPPRALRLVRAWNLRYKREIERSWVQLMRTGVAEAVPPLE